MMILVQQVTNEVNNQPLVTPWEKRRYMIQIIWLEAIVCFIVSESIKIPALYCRVETPVHPSAVGSKTPGQKWHLFSAV